MAWSSRSVLSYRVFYNPRNSYGWAMAEIRAENGGVFWLWFTKTTPLPSNIIGSSNGVAYFPYEMLESVVDTLRHERPVFVQTEPDTRQLAITTSQEPLGEGPVDSTPPA